MKRSLVSLRSSLSNVSIGVRARSSRAGDPITKFLNAFVPGSAPGPPSPFLTGGTALLDGFGGNKFQKENSGFQFSSSDPNSYNVTLALPGIEPKDVKISVVNESRLEVEILREKNEPSSLSSFQQYFAVNLPEDVVPFDEQTARATLKQ
jgi:hypothetical protein